MNFTERVKDDLCQYDEKNSLNRRLELAALLRSGGNLEITSSKLGLRWENEKALVARRLISLLKAESTLSFEISRTKEQGLRKSNRYQVFLPEHPNLNAFLDEIGLLKRGLPSFELPHQLLKNRSNWAAYLRGLFLGRGTINNPEKGYYLEFLLNYKNHCHQLKEFLAQENIEVFVRQRRGFWLLYLHNADSIVALLNLLRAHSALLVLESYRTLKEFRNNINRKVNWETANLDRTVQASAKQLAAINLIAKTQGLNSLTPPLFEVAYARIRNPYASLDELAEILEGRVSKSGVNHRLRRIIALAGKIEKEGKA